MVLQVFIFIFCLETAVIREQFRQAPRQQHLKDFATEDFTDMGYYRREACTKAFNLLLYASLLSHKPNFKFNLVLIK